MRWWGRRRVGLIEVSANEDAERESFSDFAGESEGSGKTGQMDWNACRMEAG
jgi:hypothetical protein